MNSLNIGKLTRVLVSALAATLFHVQGGLAAQAADDPQAQARELLSPTVVSRSGHIHDRVALPRAAVSGLDPQEQARRLILGGRSFPEGLESASRSSEVVRTNDRGHADAHTMARRMILGAVG